MPHVTPPSSPIIPPVHEPSFDCRSSFRAELNFWKEREKSSQNLNNIKTQVLSAQTCTFETMLTGFLTRMIQGEQDGDFSVQGSSAFREMMLMAVEFCDDKQECKEVKAELRKYCNRTTEPLRCRALTNALNLTAQYFRDKKITSAPSIELPKNEDETLFAVNEPTMVETKYEFHSTKLKPGIIALSMKSISQIYGKDNQEYGFDGWRRELAKDKRLDVMKEPEWSDVLQSWEVKASRRIMTKPLDELYGPVYGERTLATSSDTSSPSDGKRKLADSGAGHSERKRMREMATEPKTTLTPRVQAACYAIERLRSSCNIAHTIGLLLEDSTLSLCWYDAQGCIEASVDIIQELPLFVVMVMIFQRFDARMWGVPSLEIKCQYQEQQVKILADSSLRCHKRPSFTLIGRKTWTSTIPIHAYEVPASSSSERDGTSAKREESLQADTNDTEVSHNNQCLFLKSAWPDEDRRSESSIIDEARRRAEQYLGEHKQSVLDHLPVVVASDELRSTSTSIIRRILGLSTDGSRVQRWILSEKLEPIIKIPPNDFWKAFWEIIRCHFLLWRIGIAHGDISVSNLMFKPGANVVLNDFDLASVMDPGARSPDKTDYERMGTMPFMAMQLLSDKGFNGEVSRLYRHELESFAWVLYWICICVQDGQESLRSPVDEWVGVDHKQVFRTKISLGHRDLDEFSATQDYAFLHDVANALVEMWIEYDRLRTKGRLHKDEVDQHYVRDVVGKVKDCGVDILIDMSWISFTLSES